MSSFKAKVLCFLLLIGGAYDLSLIRFVQVSDVTYENDTKLTCWNNTTWARQQLRGCPSPSWLASRPPHPPAAQLLDLVSCGGVQRGWVCLKSLHNDQRAAYSEGRLLSLVRKGVRDAPYHKRLNTSKPTSETLSIRH